MVAAGVWGKGGDGGNGAVVLLSIEVRPHTPLAIPFLK
jgi:hypothetical protein